MIEGRLSGQRSGSATQRPLERLRDELSAGRLAVLVDTTTYKNAREAVSSDRVPSPIALLDLSVLTVAAVCFDEIVIQPDLIDTPHEIAGVTHILDLDVAQRHDLANVYRAASRAARRPYDLNRYEDNWATFLNRAPGTVHLDMDSVPDTRQEEYWESFNFVAAFDPTSSVGGSNELETYLAVQTVRTCFNDEVAGVLDVPYLASSVRLPVYARLIGAKADVVRVLTSVMGDVVRSPASASHPRFARVKLAAPFLLAMILRRMTAPRTIGGGCSNSATSSRISGRSCERNATTVRRAPMSTSTMCSRFFDPSSNVPIGGMALSGRRRSRQLSSLSTSLQPTCPRPRSGGPGCYRRRSTGGCMRGT